MNIAIKIIFLIIFSALLASPAYAISIGISPGRVDFQNMLKGGYAERIVTISTNTDQDMTAHFEVKGEITDWLRFEPNTTTITLSKGNPYKLKIIAEPPADARNDSYSGSITFITDRIGGIAGRAGGIVRAAVTMFFGLDVTNEEISSCRAGAFFFKDAEIGYPLEFGVTIINNGNVRIKPIISFDIWDQMQETLLSSKKVTAEEVLPTIETKILKKIKNELDVGQYWVNMDVEGCGASGLLTFSIVEKGSIVDKGTLKRITHKLWVYVKEPVQITAVFQNIGERTVFAKFKGHIKLDESIVKIIETEELEVPAGETTNFDFFFTPQNPGRYVITGRVIYNKKFTFEKGSILNVNPAPKEKIKIFPLLLYIIIVITIIFIMRKIVKEKRKRKRVF